MCFSAFASFGTGTVLSITGIATIKKTKHKNELAFASIPVFFGIQQITEGIVWSTFNNPAINSIATYIYAIYAHCWWPIFIPLAVLLLEKDKTRKKLIAGCLFAGSIISAGLLYGILTEPVTSNVYQSCIQYHLTIPGGYNTAFSVLYLLAVCGSNLFSSYKKIQVIGVLAFIFAVISYLFYNFAFASIWCFFCAVLSLLVYRFFASLHSQKTVQ